MTFFVKNPVTAPWIYRVGFWRNRIFAVLTLDIVQYLVCLICFVGKNIALRNINVRKYINSYFRIVYVPG